LRLRWLDVELAQAKLAALQYVLAAERLEDAGMKEHVEWVTLARTARQAQLTVTLLGARRQLVEAEIAARLKHGGPEAAKAAGGVVDARRAVRNAEVQLADDTSASYARRQMESYPQQSTGRRL